MLSYTMRYLTPIGVHMAHSFLIVLGVCGIFSHNFASSHTLLGATCRRTGAGTDFEESSSDNPGVYVLTLMRPSVHDSPTDDENGLHLPNGFSPFCQPTSY